MTIELLESKIRAYLHGDLDLYDFDDWVDDQDHETERPRMEADEMFGYVSLMLCEVFLSGQLRTIEMLRTDLEAMLKREPITAFWGPTMDRLVAEYTEQCQGVSA